MIGDGRLVYDNTITLLSGVSLTSGSNTYAGLSGLTMNTFSNINNYPYGKLMLNWGAGISEITGYINVYMTRCNIGNLSLDHIPVPVSLDLKNAEFVVSFPCASTRDYYKELNISLLGITGAKFYLLNKCSSTLSDFKLTLAPFSVVPSGY